MCIRDRFGRWKDEFCCIFSFENMHDTCAYMIPGVYFVYIYSLDDRRSITIIFKVVANAFYQALIGRKETILDNAGEEKRQH